MLESSPRSSNKVKSLTMSFDPNGVGIANGNLFGFPVTKEEATIVIIPVPWDATASYGKGTSDGPQAILDASTQLDFYHPKLDKAFETKVFMTPISEEWKAINDRLCKTGLDYIAFLEDGSDISSNTFYQEFLAEMNDTQLALKNNFQSKAQYSLATSSAEQRVANLEGFLADAKNELTKKEEALKSERTTCSAL